MFNGSRMGKEFSANVFNDYFRWLDGIPENDRNGHTAVSYTHLDVYKRQVQKRPAQQEQAESQMPVDSLFRKIEAFQPGVYAQYEEDDTLEEVETKQL